MNRFRHTLLAILGGLLLAGNSSAEEITIAVASNFTQAIRQIADRFQDETGDRVRLSFGSTGKHYAQIVNGAPFDAFFAADVKRPQRLDQEGLIQPGSRFTYAIGRVVLWSPDETLVDDRGQVLREGRFSHLAIANPRLAPYGRAAREVLEGIGLWNTLQPRMVRGENIGQAFQFVSSGSVELGFVAYAQVKRPGEAVQGSLWQVPESAYAPIEQQAVLLSDNPVARRFLEYVRTPEIRELIHGYGYATPEPPAD